MVALFLYSAPMWADDEPIRGSAESTREVKLKDKPKPAEVVMKVEECFKIHWLLRADDAHYWADWVSECPYTIDSVYVMIGFQDHGKNHVGQRRVAHVFRASGRSPGDSLQRAGRGFRIRDRDGSPVTTEAVGSFRRGSQHRGNGEGAPAVQQLPARSAIPASAASSRPGRSDCIPEHCQS